MAEEGRYPGRDFLLRLVGVILILMSGSWILIGLYYAGLVLEVLPLTALLALILFTLKGSSWRTSLLIAILAGFLIILAIFTWTGIWIPLILNSIVLIMAFLTIRYYKKEDIKFGKILKIKKSPWILPGAYISIFIAILGLLSVFIGNIIRPIIDALVLTINSSTVVYPIFLCIAGIVMLINPRFAFKAAGFFVLFLGISGLSKIGGLTTIDFMPALGIYMYMILALIGGFILITRGTALAKVVGVLLILSSIPYLTSNLISYVPMLNIITMAIGFIGAAALVIRVKPKEELIATAGDKFTRIVLAVLIAILAIPIVKINLAMYLGGLSWFFEDVWFAVESYQVSTQLIKFALFLLGAASVMIGTKTGEAEVGELFARGREAAGAYLGKGAEMRAAKEAEEKAKRKEAAEKAKITKAEKKAARAAQAQAQAAKQSEIKRLQAWISQYEAYKTTDAWKKLKAKEKSEWEREYLNAQARLSELS
ncbi:MAG: hypothetical protein PVG65_07050 [Candidatus Thorarchaeota archaeon]|jgi:hypothetical protein